MFKTMKFLTTVCIFGTILISCTKDEMPNENITVFKAELKGSNEPIPNASSAKGTAILNYNNNTNRFTATTSYSGLIPNSGHIHMAQNQKNGNIIFPFDINDVQSTSLKKNLIEKQSIDELPRKMMLLTTSSDNIYSSSPITYHSGVLTVQEVEALFEGKLYVDFHTKAYPNGEIRGQFEKQ